MVLGVALCVTVAAALAAAQTPPTCQSDEQVMLARCAKRRCVLGCKLCNWYYGRFNYNLFGCVNQCVLTGADIVDLGPQQCSNYMVRPGDLHRPHTAAPLGDDDE